jgi:hypothetical protein
MPYCQGNCWNAGKVERWLEFGARGEAIDMRGGVLERLPGVSACQIGRSRHVTTVTAESQLSAVTGVS